MLRPVILFKRNHPDNDVPNIIWINPKWRLTNVSIAQQMRKIVKI